MQGNKGKQKQKKQDANAKGSAKGRNALKCSRYQNERHRERNKLKRILKSNGPEAARAWAARYGALLDLKQIAAGRGRIAFLAKKAMA
jgi:hypothetical protein